MLYTMLIEPFQYPFMQKAMIACCALALGGIPLGTILILRRMTLLGEAFSHGIMPGVVISFLFFENSIYHMTILGSLSGICIAGLSRYTAKQTELSEESAFGGFYILFFAIGMLTLAASKSQKHVMCFLFGSILGIDSAMLWWCIGVSTITVISLLIIRRPLIASCFDPVFAKLIFKYSEYYYAIFLCLLCVNIVSSLQVFGNLMSIGLILLPLLCLRFWKIHISYAIPIAIGIGILASYIGIVLSFHMSLPVSTSIIAVLGIFYISSVAMFIIYKKYKNSRAVNNFYKQS
jgi:zinc/manganese transport system permease protein